MKQFLLPPLNCLVLIVAGLLLRRRWRRPGTMVATAGLALLWLCSTPLLAGWMLRSLQDDPALSPVLPLPEAEAVVVLSAGFNSDAGEYGGPTAGRLTLQRMRYGAALASRSGKPLLVSGGTIEDGAPALADMMREVLENEFGVQVRWTEARSRTTWENAVYSAQILKAEQIRRVYLVTNAWHMPRARLAFEAHDIEVVAAPTGFRGPTRFADWLIPDWKAIRDSYWAMHEWMGIAYYRLAYL